MSFNLGPPRLNQLNNGTSNVVKGMPIKDLTSDNNASFSMGRKQYTRGLVLNLTETQKQEKKWSNNRDSSDVMQRRKQNAIGSGSLNEGSNTFSFKNTSDTNTARQAVSRTRKGGSVVPKKVTGSTEIFK